MRSRLLPVLTLLSFFVMAGLPFSYLGNFGVWILRARPAGSAFRISEVLLSLDDGRFRLVLLDMTGRLPPGGPQFHVGFDHNWRVPTLRGAHLTRWLTGFEAHPLTFATGGPSLKTSACFLGVPSWCVLLLCAVAPVLRLTRKRRIPEPRGFAIEQTGSDIERMP